MPLNAKTKKNKKKKKKLNLINSIQIKRRWSLLNRLLTISPEAGRELFFRMTESFIFDSQDIAVSVLILEYTTKTKVKSNVVGMRLTIYSQ